MGAVTTQAGSGSRSWLDRLWASIADRGSAYAAVPDADTPPLERAERLAQALLSQRGEASGAALARELQAALASLAAPDRLSFYRFLAAGFGPDPEKLRVSAEAYLADPNAERAAQLFESAEPERQELLRRMNMSPGGTAALVAMRRDLLAQAHGERAVHPLDADLRHLLGSWFNRGFLELRRIDWQTPAAVLEKLITYEAVHQIAGWSDLRRRLASDRRCFAFFHPALPGEPLIFVEVALTEGLATAVQPLLAREDDEVPAVDALRRERAARADTAIFYSISNCQDGLRGVSFGNFLIKQVVEELKAELPQLRRFSTLSPVPGFRRWLEKRLAQEAEAATMLALPPPDETQAVPSGSPAGDPDAPAREADAAGAAKPAVPRTVSARSAPAKASPARSGADLPLLREDEIALLREASGPELAAEPPATLWRAALAAAPWLDEPALAEASRRPLMRLCAEYLTQVHVGRGPADPVARFHLGNGAQLERVNWLANTAPRGISESYGLMVNYLYAPDRIEANHETFVQGKVVRSAVVDALMEPPKMQGGKRQLLPSLSLSRRSE